ncbi:MAG: M10 family metallopeptidase, partial [Pseudomonadota bacterium]
MSENSQNKDRRFEIELAGRLPTDEAPSLTSVANEDASQWTWTEYFEDTSAVSGLADFNHPETTHHDVLEDDDDATMPDAIVPSTVATQLREQVDEDKKDLSSAQRPDVEDRASNYTHDSNQDIGNADVPAATFGYQPSAPTDHVPVFKPKDWELPPAPPTVSYGAHDLEGLMGQLNGSGSRWGEPGDAVHLRIAFPQFYSEFPIELLDKDDLRNEDGLPDAVYAFLERGLRAFDETMIENTLEAIRLWTEHTTSLTFEIVEPDAEADIYFYGVSRETGSGAHGTVLMTRDDGSMERASRIVLDTDDGFPSTNPGSSGFTTILHEVGHALGLSHPGEYDASDDIRPTYLRDAEYIEDTEQYSVMSYFSETWTGADYQGEREQSLRTHDILAIQEIYGINWNLRSGDTRYGYTATDGIPSVFDFSNLGEGGHPTRPVITIFDGGGTDTLDLRYDGSDLVLDLRPGAFSSTHGLTHNISLAHRMTEGITDATQGYIENAVGGSGNDRIIGNVRDNSLVGNVGDDTLLGGEGQDAYYGGTGSDTLDFSDEASAFEVDLSSLHDNPGIVEGRAMSSDGTEVVRDVENVWLGSANDIIIGSSKSNELSGGGGNDLIRGLGGGDRLEGGDGNDTLDGGAG